MKLILPLILWCCFLGTFTEATAQISPYESHIALYRDAEELYEKKLYAAAQRKLGDFLENERYLRGDDFNDLHVNARYMQAVSQYHLEQSDAALSLTQFAEEFPENTKAMMAYYYLGNHYFDNGEYAKAIDPYFFCYSSSSIAKEKNDEVVFKLGYCYFHEENNPRADRIQANRFLELAASSATSPYKEDAQYYRAILLYNERDYERAYSALKALEVSNNYSGEMKVYLAHTLLKLQRYDELYELANSISLDPNDARQNAEVFAIVANASYEENDFAKAVQYFDRYAATRRPMTRVSNFRYAYSLYQLSKYREAIPVYEKVLSPRDSLAQVASYYLGFSFLKTGDPESAKFAFSQAANSNQIDNNPEFAMDATYQYGKVCFETQDYEEAYRAFSKLTDGVSYPNFNKVDEVRQLIGELFVYSKNYREAIEYFENTPLRSSAARRAYQSACYYYGLELYNQKNYNLTASYFAKAQQVNEDRDVSLSAMYWDAEAKFRAENFSAARMAYGSYLNAQGARNNLFYQYGNYGLGWAYFREKNYNQSYTYFTRFAEGRTAKTPKRPVVDAYLRAGDSKFLLKQYQQADDLYRKVAQSNLGFQDFAFYQWGESLYRQRQYQRSVSTFGQIVEKYKRSELRDNALDRISEIYGNWIKDFTKSAYYANILVKDYPRSPLAADAYNRLAYAAYNTGKQSQAVSYYKKVLSDFPSDKKNSQAALDNLASLLPPAEFDRILRDYRRNNPETDQNLTELIFNTGLDRFFAENYESAISQFSTYIKDAKNGPHYYEALLYRARSYKEIGQTSRALSDYATIYNAPVNNEFTYNSLLEAGQLYFDLKDYQRSLEVYETLDRVAQNLQNRVQAKFGMADAFLAMSNYAQAKRTLQEIAGNSEVAESSRTRAKFMIGQSDYETGSLTAAFTTFQEIERNYSDEYAARSQYMITRIYFDRGSFEEAYNAGVYMKNNYPSFNYWKARTYLVVAEANYAMGEIFQAKGTLQSLVDQTKNNFPDVYEAARKRLAEIEEEERRNDATLNSGN